MREKVDLYNYQKRLSSELAKLDSPTFIERNRQLILDFRRQMVAEGIGTSRQIKVIWMLRKWSMLCNKPFDALDKDDIIDLVGLIECQGWSKWTKHDHKMMLRKFFKWLKNSENYPKEVSWIRAAIPRNELMSNQLITEEEIKKMVEVATNPRDKALLFVLYESGCRIGELLSLRIGDVEFDEYGAILNVDGKTGKRRVRIIRSVPLLNLWLNCHKDSKNQDSFLWVSLYDPKLSYLTPSAVRSFIRKAVARAGIKKRVYPHLFRHTRATHLASQITESLLKKHMGWTQSSNMPATYVHLSGQELDKALLKASGIQLNEEKKEDKLNVIQCPRCRNDNSAGTKYCFSCGFCFDIKIAIEIDETKKKVNELLDALVSRPEKLAVLLKLIQSED